MTHSVLHTMLSEFIGCEFSTTIGPEGLQLAPCLCLSDLLVQVDCINNLILGPQCTQPHEPIVVIDEEGEVVAAAWCCWCVWSTQITMD
jgi:hypothetical protein